MKIVAGILVVVALGFGLAFWLSGTGGKPRQTSTTKTQAPATSRSS